MKKWFESDKKYIMPTYKRKDVVFVSGKGNYLYGHAGKKYLDFFTGISVCNLGHCHPKIIKVVKNQLNKLFHVSNHYYTLPQVQLAELLVKRSYGINSNARVFFSNSGAEANECAIKLARKYGREKKYEIIVFNNSFHGRTLATLTATGQKKFHKGFLPLIPGFKYAKFNNIDSVRKLINNKTCAVLIEPIQGEGGVYPATKKFLAELRKLCNKHKLLLMFDEIQCGMGRTGKLFAYQYYGVQPDIITLAKSISNGLPLSVTIVSGKHNDIFNYGDHGSTFGGNIISCSAAIEVLKIIDNKLLDKVTKSGKYFIKRLNYLKSKYSFIKEVRGTGLMLGIELDIPGDAIVKKCLEKGLVINCTQEKTIRFLPPFTINRKDIDSAINTLDKIFKNIKI